VTVRTALDTAIAQGIMPGGVCEVSVAGVVTATEPAGVQATVDARGGPLGPDDREAVTIGTRYDLASVTKLFSAVTLLRLVDAGALDLDASIGEWLPGYRAEKRDVTLRHLLAHTSGLAETWDGWHAYVAGEGTPEARWLPRDRAAVLRSIEALPLVRPAGTTYAYSCVGYITAMACAEAATGRDWATLVSELVLTPLALTDTGFVPSDPTSVAPTEFQPAIGRGLVRGVVHDETAYALEGVSANAGLFSTASDLRRFGESMVDGFGELLSEESARGFWTDQLPDVLSGEPPAWGQGLGPRIGQVTWMTAGLRSARGHNGFVGTSLLAERERGVVVALLTNRVHRSRDQSEGDVVRTLVHRAVLADLQE
jgi:CubicO group peptidase (beta-lactamase class C family)